MPQHIAFYSSQVAAESEATQHLAELEKPFKCTECDSSFTTNAAKNIHSKTHIRGQMLKCSICPYMTSDYNELRKHRLNDNCMGKQKIFRCHACDFMCHSKPMMKSHFFSAHTDPEKLHECPDCDFKALKINALNIHVKQQHSAPMEYACTSCDFVCNSQTVIKNHIIKRHSDENMIGIDGEQEGEDEVEQNATNINKYACASCDYMCSSMAAIKIHISENHSTDSPIKSTNLQGLEEPLDPNTEKSQVKRNLLSFEQPLEEKYAAEPKYTETPSIKKFYCQECDFQCFKKRGIEVHMTRVHKFSKNVPKDEKHKQVDYELEPIPIGNHPDPGYEKINSRDERRVYKCPLCKFKGTLFGFKIHRNKHMTRKCRICGAKCKSEKGLAKHIKTHAGYSCDLCDFQCETDLGFQSHMDLSHNTAAMRFSCPKCSYKCNTQMDLRRHVSVHEPQKQFTCPECEDSYDEKSELMHHMLSMNHTGGKPFSCTKCKAQFLTYAGLKIHLESHEPELDSGQINSDDEMEDEIEEEEYDDENEASTERKRKSLTPRKVVDDYYVDDEDYEEAENSNDELESCDECEFEGTERELKIHLKSHRTLQRANAKKGPITKRLRCFYSVCTFKSNSFTGLQLHARSHVKELENKDTGDEKLRQSPKKLRTEKLRCAHPSCDYTAITLRGIHLHAKMIHQNFKLEENLTPRKLETNYIPKKEFSCEEKMEGCPDCDYFGTSKGLKLHSRSHSVVKPYKCKECDFKCLAENVLDTHISLKHGIDEFACKECDYKGISTEGFARHYSRAHNILISYDKENKSDSFPCDVCDYKGKSIQGLRVHKSRMHSVKLSHIDVVVETQIATVPKSESCLDNKEVNVSEQHSIEEGKDISGRIGEKALEDKSFACDDCDYVGTSRGLKTHQCKQGNDPFACSRCDFIGTSTQILRKHTLRMHSVKVTQNESEDHLSVETPEITVSKSKSCSDNQELKVSEQDSTNEKDIAIGIDKGGTEDKSFACKDCDYVGSAKGLKSHSKAHSMVKPFSCEECDFKCFTQKVLDTHVLRNHGKFVCSMCDYKGPSAQGLKCHSLRVHSVKFPLNEPKSDISIDSQELNVPENESYSDHEDFPPDTETCIDEEMLTDKEPCLEKEEISPEKESFIENEEISPEKESYIENEEISPEKESCLENKEVIFPKEKSCFNNDEKTVANEAVQKTQSIDIHLELQKSEKSKESDLDISQDDSKKALPEKRVRQVNTKYSIKDYFVSLPGSTPVQGCTPEREHTERQSKRFKKEHKENNDDIKETKPDKSDSQESTKRFKKEHKENNDDIKETKPDKSDSQESTTNETEAPLKHSHNIKGTPCKACALKKVNKQPENKEQQRAIRLNTPETENTQRPKRIKLVRNNTPGRKGNNKEVPTKDVNQKDSPCKEGALKKLIKPTENENQQANKLKKEQKENNADSKGQKLGSHNSPDSVTDDKEVLGKDVHHKDSPGKVVFIQNVNKKKKFDEYMKKQENKPNGAKFNRKNIKREKGLTCLCLECGARFTAKTALEKHMSIHL